MDEQDPRLGVDRLGGPGDEALTDLKYSAPSETEELPDERTREIRAEIEQTREHMSETVNAIQDRLRPSTLASNAADRVKDAAMDKVRDVADSESVMYVRANPIPAAMVGIGIAGLAWLAMGGRDNRSSDRPYRRRGSYSTRRDWRTLPTDDPSGFYEGPASEYLTQTESVAHTPALANAARYSADRQAGISEGMGSRPPHEGYDYGASQTSQRRPRSDNSAFGGYGQNPLQRTWNESPLLMGAASAVFGALVGLAIPESERENQLMGEARDSVIDTVQETVREKVDRVQQVATDAVSAVQDAAKSAVGLTSSEDSDKQEGGRSSGT
jgi:gas vesicle protein